jgi:hypothetical protein
MSYSSNIAARLIEYAPPAAVDLLFPKIGNGSVRFGIAPSSPLIRERWSTVSADLAISLVTVITDTELLDFISMKEKRKTVRSAICANRNLHPVTRLFFLQEGLRANDWDLISTVMRYMPVDDQIAYAIADERLQRYVNDRDLGKAIAALETDDELIAAFRSLGTSRSYVIDAVISINADRALRCMTAAGLTLERHGLHRCPESASDDTIRTLIATAGDRRDFMFSVASALDIDRLAAIDPQMLDLLGDARYPLTAENAAKLLSYGKLDVVMSLVRRNHLDGDTAQLLAAAAVTDAQRFTISLNHPSGELAAALVTDPVAFGRASLELNSSSFFAWIVRIAPFLGIEKTMQVIEARPAERDIDGRVYQQLMTTFGCTSDELLAAMPDSLLSNISGLEVPADPVGLLNRALTVPGPAAYRLALQLAAPVRRTLELELLTAKILFTEGDESAIADWLRHASRPAVEAVVVEHGQTLASIVLRNRRHSVSDEWADLLVPLLAPSSGWGSLPNAELTRRAMMALTEMIGDDIELWETTLGLYQDWTGTLSDLVSAARTL